MAKKTKKKTVTDKQLAANQENGKKGGRPRFELDADQWRMFDAMCSAGALEVDIAEAFQVDRKTIDSMVQRERQMGFSAYRNQKKGRGRAALAAKQYEMAMGGNTAMAIFLGKNWLGQSDRHSVDSSLTVSSSRGKLRESLEDPEVRAAMSTLSDSLGFDLDDVELH